MKTLFAASALALLLIGGVIFYSLNEGEFLMENQNNKNSSVLNWSGETKTAMVAGGCFWCVEADLEKLPGVISAVSGYAGGSGKNPTYENYAATGHREVVEITYDPKIVSYGEIVEFLIKHVDPTDSEGSFYDRGKQYSPAVYFENKEEEEEAKSQIKKIDEARVYAKPLTIEVLPRSEFHPAEDYHQDYYKNNSLKYRYYRNASGRDDFIEEHWGGNVWPQTDSRWENFEKPNDQTLKETLTDMQFKVTQRDGTERAFENEYHDNKRAGIYVDIVSGEPLFSSLDKYDSGTGWPSFTKPLAPENIVTRNDWSILLGNRTEVRSRHGDSHLGHVFEDGPQEHGGLRYCMNSAALRFVPKEQMESEGYGEYLSLFD